MTASLIDAATVAAIQAGRAKGPAASLLPSAPEGSVLSPERAERLTPQEWRRAWFKTVTFLDQHLTEVKKTREDGTELAALLADQVLDLSAFGLTVFAGPHPDPRKLYRQKIDQVLKVIHGGLEHWLKSCLVEGEAMLREQAEEKANALLADAQAAFEQDRAMIAAGLDQAQQDVSEYRRAAEAASAQLVREREAHAREVAELKAMHAAGVKALQQHASRAARIATDQERQWNEQRRQLLADQATAQSTIAHLNAECERLEALHVPQLKVVTRMPSKANKDLPSSALEEASLTNYLRDTLNDPKIKLGAVVISDEQLSAWRATYPTPESQLVQVRAVVLPILLRRVA